MTVTAELALGRAREDVRLRILLVEDDPNDAELVQACLADAQRSGAEIVHAANLAEGLEVLDTQTIHLTVLDLDLPDSCGFETLERLSATARTPVIVVTGNPHPALAAEALKRRAYEVLRKNELDARSLMRIVRLAHLQNQAEGRYRALVDHSREAMAGERRFRALVENSADGILLADGDGRTTYASPGARRMLGYARDEALGWRIAEMVEPQERAQFDALVAAALAHPGAAHALRARVRRRSGGHSVLEGSCTDLRADESVRAVVYNFRDVAEREHAEARARRMSLMYTALSAANEAAAQLKDPQTLYQRICDIAVQLGGMRLASVRVHNPQTHWLESAGSAGEGANYLADARVSIDAAIPEGQGLAGPAMREDRTTVSNDFVAEARMHPWHAGARRFGFAAAACVPVRRGGKPVALLILYSAEAGCFDAELVTLVERMAANVGHALDRLDAERRLRESEARFRSLANLSSDWSWEQDEELRFTWASPGAEARGAPLQVTLGKRRWEIAEFAPLCGSWEPHKAVLAQREPFRDFEYVRTEAGGERRYIAISGAPVFDEAGRFRGYRGTARDISERKRAQLGMERLKTMYAALGSANEAILRAKSQNEVLAHACEIAVGSGDFLLGTVFMLEAQGGLLRRVAASGPMARFAEQAPVCVDASVPGGQGLIGLACRAMQPAIANDYPADTRIHRNRMTLRPYRIGAAAVFPLTVDGELAGVFGLQHAERHAFSEELTALLQRLADNISFALQNLRHEARRMAAEEELKRFRVALDASADSILLVDAKVLEIIDLNETAASTLGYERAELIGRSPAAVYEGRDDAAVRAEHEKLMASPDGAHLFRAHFRRRDGSIVAVEGSRRLLRAEGRCYVVVIARDITERLKGEERLQQSLERFKIVARATNDVVYDWDLDTDQLWWNENFCSVFGFEPSEVGAYLDSWTSRIHPEDVDFVEADARAAIEGGYKSWSGEYRFRRKDGSYAVVYDRGMVIRNSVGKPVRMIGAIVDITARKDAERRMRLHAQRQEIIARLGQFALGEPDLGKLMAEAARVLRAGGCDVAAIAERVGEEFLVRAASGEGAEASVGTSKRLPPDASWVQLLDCAGAVVHDRRYFESRRTDRPWSSWLRRLGSGVYVPIHAENAAFGVLLMGSLRDAAFDAEDLSFGEAIAHVLSAAVGRHQTQTRLAYMAEFDALTGLPNRRLLQDRLAQSVVQANRRGSQGAVLFIDLDRFKLINDTLGHHVGDRLIAQVGQRLKDCVRAGDTVGRVSGDEFGVVLTDLAEGDDAALVAQKILDALGRAFDLGGNEAYVTASIGISVFPADGADAETLLKNADMAMYRAKELTRNAYCFFTAEMNQRSVAKLQLNTDLRRATERREFVLHYQPKIDLRDGRIHGVEALLRWNHPQRGMVSPAEFIPALEDSGLILPVGEWVLEEAAAQLRAWQQDGFDVVPVAVNLSAKQFRRRDLDTLIRGALAGFGVSASLIELEITESCLMDDPEDAVRLLASLRRAGLKISVDDFGTGYSSLSYLTRLPLTALKIDRSFVRDAVSSGEAASIVRAVIDMAHNLNFTVIAEGVESREQVAFLRRHGCDLGQGYLFDRPMPAAQLATRLRRAA